ncbi:MAG: cation diffusion facilitator family transporter [Eubacteriales bacterium]|nr:cation diffusion facilitator family transporter [Eubacteriales bacterium]
MTNWLIRRFVHDSDNTKEPGVRTAYGTLGSCVGILVNLLLAAGKFFIGLLSGSLAITADAANNLSDAAGSIMALVSTRIAQKPVDAEHPFGHGRMEYLGSLGVGVLIVIVAVGLLKDGVDSALHPAPLTISWVVLAILIASELAKTWLFFFYRKLGRATDNGTLLAASKDSLSDVMATGAVLLCVGINAIWGLEIDGYVGILVALIVLKAGFDVCKDTIDQLLGGKPDPEKAQRIRELLLSYPGILGVHDLVIHDYGPGRCVASLHAEVSDKSNIVEIHEVIDNAEREIGSQLHMPICIHMDPIATTDETTNRIHQQITDFIHRMDPCLSLHDFRMVPGQDHINLIFDCVLPAGYKGKEELLQSLGAYAASLDPRYRLVVQFDTDYT